MDIKLRPIWRSFACCCACLPAVSRESSVRGLAGASFPGWCDSFSTSEKLVVTLVVELAMTLPMAIYFHRITLFALPVNLFILPLLLVLLPLP